MLLNKKIFKQRYDVSSTISAYGEFSYSDDSGIFIAKKNALKQLKSEGAAKLLTKFAPLEKLFKEPDLSTIIKQRIKNGYGYGSTSNSLTSFFIYFFV